MRAVYKKEYELRAYQKGTAAHSDERDGLIQISGNRITFHINPLKLFLSAAKSSRGEDNGTVYADNFRAANPKDAPES